jgi:hypothetical protein
VLEEEYTSRLDRAKREFLLSARRNDEFGAMAARHAAERAHLKASARMWMRMRLIHSRLSEECFGALEFPIMSFCNASNHK